MCGIAGFFLTKINKRFDSEKVAYSMATSLEHRGPDKKKIWFDNDRKMFLSFSRLSILDLSDHGDQPMTSNNGRFIILFNGEIYNHKSLRKELDNLDYKIKWNGRSDTEILVNLIEYFGFEQTLKKIIGMFSIVVFDQKLQKLFLARDRVGEKPLYYGFVDENFIFASELKAFEVFPNFQKELNLDAVYNFLKFSVISGDKCVYKNIYKISPATFIEINLTNLRKDKKIKPVLYWNYYQNYHNNKAELNKNISLEEATGQVKILLQESIRDQLVSDVPLGVHLSGGIDSSLITAIASQNLKKIKTFSIGFENKEYDESIYSEKIAKILGTSHNKLILNNENLLSLVSNIGNTLDEPFADSSQLPMMALCNFSRRNIKVALTGDGGDEIFGGYNRYIFSKKYLNLLKKSPNLLKNLYSNFFKFILKYEVSTNTVGKILKISHSREQIEKISEIIKSNNFNELYENFTKTSQFSEKVFSLILKKNEERYNFDQETFSNYKVNILEKLMFNDLKKYLPDDILVKSDRISMSSSLELRSPFLDFRLIEFMSTLPSSFKVNDGKGKVILRKILKDFLPDDLFNRPKMGFSFPLNNWILGPLGGWAQDLIFSTDYSNIDFLNQNYIKNLWHDHKQNKNKGHFLWNILMFLTWLKRK